MSTLVEDTELNSLTIAPDLYNAVKTSVQSAMDMCGVKVRCVGVSAVPRQDSGSITGMIGVYGKVSGFLSYNVSEPFVIQAVEGLLQEEFGELTSQVVDGAGELTNIIGGGVKSALAGSKWTFSHITVPSVIVGQQFTIAYARGLEFLTVSFENENQEAVRLEDRMMHVSLSLLTL